MFNVTSRRIGFNSPRGQRLTRVVADVFRAMEISSAPVMHGVSDGRASSVMVIQQLYGVGAARYWHGLYAAAFSLPRRNFRDTDLKTSRDFSTSLMGRLEFIKFRR